MASPIFPMARAILSELHRFHRKHGRISNSYDQKSHPQRLVHVMKPMSIFGIILVIVGVILLVYQGFSFTQRENVANVGPVHINADKRKDRADSAHHWLGGDRRRCGAARGGLEEIGVRPRFAQGRSAQSIRAWIRRRCQSGGLGQRFVPRSPCQPVRPNQQSFRGKNGQAIAWLRERRKEGR